MAQNCVKMCSERSKLRNNFLLKKPRRAYTSLCHQLKSLTLAFSTKNTIFDNHSSQNYMNEIKELIEAPVHKLAPDIKIDLNIVLKCHCYLLFMCNYIAICHYIICIILYD